MRRYALQKILWAIFVHCEVVTIAKKETKTSFILYKDSFEIVKRLSIEQRGHLFTAIFEYERGETIHELDPLTEMAFLTIKQYLDRNRERYNRRCEINAENGKKGGRPKKTERLLEKPNGFLENQTKANETLNDNDTDCEKDIGTENAFEREHINSVARPSLEEIKAYISENGLRIDAESFFDYYESVDWVDKSGNQIKDWKAKARNWAKRESEFKRAPEKQSIYSSDASYDLEDFGKYAVGSPAWIEQEKKKGRDMSAFE